MASNDSLIRNAKPKEREQALRQRGFVSSSHDRRRAPAHLGDALKSKPKTAHHPAIGADHAGTFPIRLGYHDCEIETRFGIELAALTVIRLSGHGCTGKRCKWASSAPQLDAVCIASRLRSAGPSTAVSATAKVKAMQLSDLMLAAACRGLAARFAELDVTSAAVPEIWQLGYPFFNLSPDSCGARRTGEPDHHIASIMQLTCNCMISTRYRRTMFVCQRGES